MPPHNPLFESLASKFSSPFRVQKLLFDLQYNTHETMRSAKAAWEIQKIHCLEATFLSAAILELQGFPPLYLYLDSQDNLGHVVYLFKQGSKWGALGRSKEQGLQGRKPIFNSVESLVDSYVDPYVDETAKIVGYSVGDFSSMKAPWRDSQQYVWQVERQIINQKQRPIRVAFKRHQQALRAFRLTGHKPRAHWWYETALRSNLDICLIGPRFAVSKKCQK